MTVSNVLRAVCLVELLSIASAVHLKTRVGLRSQTKSREERIKESFQGQQIQYGKQSGPKRGSDYRPSIGYEPYWAEGEWVFQREAPANETSVCGGVCSKIYSNYGAICGRNKDFQYKDFADYCQMKNQDCSGAKGWMIGYRGKCRPEVRLRWNAPPVFRRTRQPISRIIVYLASFYSRYPHLTGSTAVKKS